MISDADKVGAANVARCKMTTKEWDESTKDRQETGQCKGIFFSCFGTKMKTRRCEREALDFCEVCTEVRRKAKDGFISLGDVKAYDIDDSYLMAREGVKKTMVFWEEEVAKRKKDKKTRADFPGISAKQMVHMIMIDGMVVKPNAKSRKYKRSAIVVQAQNEI